MFDSILEKIQAVKKQFDTDDVPEPFRELTLTPEDYMTLRREIPQSSLDAKQHPLTNQIGPVMGMPIKIQKPVEPSPDELLPDQEEMDKLASALTEAVLQLRAGDMAGARKTLNDADRLCDVRIHTTTFPPADHYLDALRYGTGMAELKAPGSVPDWPRTAMEIRHRQEIAERQMRIMQDEILANLNNTTPSTYIEKDPGA